MNDPIGPMRGLCVRNNVHKLLYSCCTRNGVTVHDTGYCSKLLYVSLSRV